MTVNWTFTEATVPANGFYIIRKFWQKLVAFYNMSRLHLKDITFLFLCDFCLSRQPSDVSMHNESIPQCTNLSPHNTVSLTLFWKILLIHPTPTFNGKIVLLVTPLMSTYSLLIADISTSGFSTLFYYY